MTTVDLRLPGSTREKEPQMKTALLILMIEILLPGGTLLALGILWYRRRIQGGNKLLPNLRMAVAAGG